MHGPWLQVEHDVIDLTAPDLAVVLDWTEAEAGWGLLKLFGWALGRCPDNAPPSTSDVIPGPDAARRIARAARWHGDPDAYVDACTKVLPAVLERVEGGIRVRGLKRYDTLWRKNHPAQAAKWDAEHRTGTKPGRNRSEVETKPGGDRSISDRQTQTQTQTQTQKETVVSAPPPTTPIDPQRAFGALPLPVDAQVDRRKPEPPFQLTPTPERRGPKLSAQQQLAQRIQAQRTEVLGEDVAPDTIYTVERLNTSLKPLVAYDEGAVLEAHLVFLENARAQSLDPPCPLWAFAQDFGKYASASQRRAGGSS